MTGLGPAKQGPGVWLSWKRTPSGDESAALSLQCQSAQIASLVAKEKLTADVEISSSLEKRDRLPCADDDSILRETTDVNSTTLPHHKSKQVEPVGATEQSREQDLVARDRGFTKSLIIRREAYNIKRRRLPYRE